MPSERTKKTILIGGLALLLLLGTGGAAVALADDDEPDLPPPPPPKPEPGELEDNWGAFPESLRAPFLEAEKAARLPGMARFMAIWAWGAFRAKKAFVSPEEAAAIAAANPDLCLECQNLNDAQWSRKALEQVVLPLGEEGKYGVGQFKTPWVKPFDWNKWADFGSAGLFDMLAGSVVHLGIHEGFLSPILDWSPEILYDERAQLYLAGTYLHRIFNSPTYKILSPTAAETWARARAVTASPAQFLAWQKGDKTNPIATEAMANFLGRAKELGIDLGKVANPTLQDVKNWPGAANYFAAVGGDL